MARAARRWARLVPEPLRSRVARSLWRSLELEAVGPQGLRFDLMGRADWVIFCELFLELEYQAAVDRILTTEKSRDRLVLDLGANIGLFCYFLLTRWVRLDRPNSSLRVVAVEGSPENFERLEVATRGWTVDGVEILPVRGVVGRREGKVRFASGPTHSTNAVSRSSVRGAELAYLDLERFLPDGAWVDLLKCDIEGSEEDFLSSYPELLRRTSVAVVELHPQLCDAEACRRLLIEAGLRPEGIVAVDPGLSSTELFAR